MTIRNKQVFQHHAVICKTLSNPLRLEILSVLRDGKKSVNEIASLTELRQATVSQHLAIMRQAGVVITQREGINVFYSVANPKINQACDLISEVLFEHITGMSEMTATEAPI